MPCVVNCSVRYNEVSVHKNAAQKCTTITQTAKLYGMAMLLAPLKSRTTGVQQYKLLLLA